MVREWNPGPWRNGIRSGLKIRGRDSGVRVRFPPALFAFLAFLGGRAHAGAECGGPRVRIGCSSMADAISIDQASLAELCRRHHIRRLSLFGSVLRPDFGPESDVDVLVEFEPDHVPGFLALYGIEAELSSLLDGRPVDLSSRLRGNRRGRGLEDRARGGAAAGRSAREGRGPMRGAIYASPGAITTPPGRFRHRKQRQRTRAARLTFSFVG